MLTRLYIDNFRCFVNFEYRPARRQLIIGRNGSGKSSLIDALFLIRQFVSLSKTTHEMFSFSNWTKWANSRTQTFEIEASLKNGRYAYRLELEFVGEPPRSRIAVERVEFEGRLVLDFTKGEVSLFSDGDAAPVVYPYEPDRSALATARHDNVILTEFKQWIGGLYCFRLNPFAMTLQADGEDLYPNLTLSNIAAWYRHLTQAHPNESYNLRSSLRAALDGLDALILEPAGENVRLLVADFVGQAGVHIRVGLNQLSDGQRCLICLYVILHFVLSRDCTVLIDEPDNFVALPEIQPWLMEVADMVDGGHGQIILISHHPEAINQWAPQCGVQLVRGGTNEAHIEPFKPEPSSPLPPSELVARGWERG